MLCDSGGTEATKEKQTYISNIQTNTFSLQSYTQLQEIAN